MRPGEALRRVAEQFASQKTMRQLIEPALADLQVEHRQAKIQGRPWAARRVLVAGYFALAQALMMHACDRVSERFGHPALLTVVATVAIAPLFITPFLPALAGTPGAVVYLVPQALAVAVPVGLLFALLPSMGSDVPRRKRLILCTTLGAACCLAVFLNVAWLSPAANDAFRREVAATSFVAKGANELTFGELAERLDAARPSTGRTALRPFALSYHSRLALSLSPLLAAVFALSMARHGRTWRLPLGMLACAVFSSFYLTNAAARLALESEFPVVAVAWLPNVVLAVAVAVSTGWQHLASRGGSSMTTKPAPS